MTEDRPTRQQVDEALGSADVHDDYVWAFAAKVLAAEVRALRAENARLRIELAESDVRREAALRGKP